MLVTENFLVNKHLSIDKSQPTGILFVDVYKRKSKWRMGYMNALFQGHRLWRGRHGARLELRISIYKSITSQIHTIALNVIISWEVGRGLVEIEQAGIIILVLTFFSQLTLRDHIGTNEVHLLCIESIWFCPVEFNSPYPANKNGIFSSRTLDIFRKIQLIQVSSIANYRNKRLPRLDRVVLVLK